MADRRQGETGTQRHHQGTVQRKHYVNACRDADSLWVEIAGPQGGPAWQMAPVLARDLAVMLNRAADTAENLGRAASEGER